MPTLKVEIPTVTEGEDGIIKLTLSQASSQSIDVTVSDSASLCNLIDCPQGTAAAGGNDWSTITGTITFAAGETTKMVSFTATDDSTSEPTEVFLFAVGDLLPSEATIDSSTPPDGSVPAPYWIVRIQDNDNPANPNVTIAPGTSPVTEGTSATFTVTATPAPTTATTVSVAVTEDTSGGQDFVAVSNETTHTVSIPASGNSYAGTATLTIPTVVDTTQEPHGAVTATVSTGTGYTVGNPSSATVTVHDDDGTPLPPEISVSLPISEGESRSDAGEKKIGEGEGATGIGFNLAADQPLPSALTVCVRVTESGGDRVASGAEGIQTANMPSSVTNGSGAHTLTWTTNTDDDPDSSVTVEVVAPSTVGCSVANDAYTVSSSDGSDKLLIQDDEDTTVSLTSTDMTMTEGDATDTATLTISLDRRLYAGETIGVPIALATTTDAKLPGSTDSGTANHDFTVSAAAGSGHSGVTLVNALTVNPRVVFTGHGTNTVQTATVTLTPVASRDDGDAAHETITATLASLGLVDTTVSGGVTAHATNNAATLSLEDDEAAPAPCPAQNTVYSEVNLRILENGGVATYCMRLTTAPLGGDTIVTLGRDGGNRFAANFSPATLTFTVSNYMTPQQVTVTGADEPGTHRNRPDMRVTHTANGGGYSSKNLGWVQVEVDDAPELEAWDTAVWNVNDFAAKVRPNTVKATRGFRYFWNDFAPITGLWYKLRLSNRPETGGTVTVTVTSSDPDKFGLALRPGNTPQASLTLTFEDREADPGCHNGGYNDIFENRGVITPSHGQIGEDRDNTPDTSWRCYRRIWVINVQDRNDPSALRGCSTISHTATGGGLRPTYVGSIRAHAIAGAHVPSNAVGTGCDRITGTDEAGDDKNYNPQASPAQTATLSITAPADANEGDSGTRDLEFTVTKSAGTADATGYQICFTGTATIHTPSALVFSAPYPAIPAASDYQAVWGIGSGNYTVWNQNCIESTVPANQTSPRANHIIGIRVKGDTDAESDETVIATLSLDGRNPGVTLGASVATHTIRDDDAVSVPTDWALKPEGVEGGESFRLLFVTSTGRDATSTEIADYNTFVQTRAKAGHSSITDAMGDQFKVVGSTSAVDARNNTGTDGTGVAIHWLNGDKVADDYADFYDGSWDSSLFRNESGNAAGAQFSYGRAAMRMAQSTLFLLATMYLSVAEIRDRAILT